MKRKIVIYKARIVTIMVDDDDYELLSDYKWCVVRSNNQNKTLYVSRQRDGKTIYLHREIAKAKKGEYVDHINGDGLDNRKANLRICSHSQNLANARTPSTNTTGYKGVSKRKKSYRAYIMVNKKQINLGCYKTPEDASKAYDEAAKRYFGDFARLNNG